jgi:hypothetical protein
LYYDGINNAFLRGRMPITAKLSQRFYQTFGDEIANELVDWFNAVDDTYKAQLRELNEVNFQRFDAKMGQHLADLRGDLRSEIAQVRTELLTEIARLRAELRGEIAQLGTDLRAEMASLSDRLTAQIIASERRTTDLIVGQTRWLIGLWAAQVAVLVGTVFIVLRAR